MVKERAKETDTPSTSKVIILTPDRIAKLGLSQQIQKFIKSNVKDNCKDGTGTKTSNKNNPVRVNLPKKRRRAKKQNKNKTIDTSKIVKQNEPRLDKRIQKDAVVVSSIKTKLANILRGDANVLRTPRHLDKITKLKLIYCNDRRERKSSTVTKDANTTIAERKPLQEKVRVLSNTQISLPQSLIDDILKKGTAGNVRTLVAKKNSSIDVDAPNFSEYENLKKNPDDRLINGNSAVVGEPREALDNSSSKFTRRSLRIKIARKLNMSASSVTPVASSTPKKRGRKRKIDNGQTDTSGDVSSTPETPKTNKRGRPRKSGISVNSITGTIMKSLFSNISTRKAAALPENETVTIDGGGDASSTVEASPASTQHWSQVEIKTERFDDGMVTCAVCEKKMENELWTKHRVSYHNNLAWKVGEPPLDLNDQKFVINVLNELYKNKKPLYCDLCGETKKSVMGFLSHRSMCQKTNEEISALKVKCEHCQALMLPVSLSMHLKYCRVLKPPQPVLLIDDESGVRGKRKAATKAENLLKEIKIEPDSAGPSKATNKLGRLWLTNFDFHPTVFVKKRIQNEIAENGVAKCFFDGCPFDGAADVDVVAKHIFECDKKPTEGFTCKFCIQTFKHKDDIVVHVKVKHIKSEDPDSLMEEDAPNDGENFEIEEHVAKTKQITKSTLLHGIKFLLQNRYCKPSTGVTYPPAFHWSLKFVKNNYAVSDVFPRWKLKSKDYESVRPSLVNRYLPELRYSVNTARIDSPAYINLSKLGHQWKRYKLFEGENHYNGTASIFCGGSIFAMAWAPTPYDSAGCEQILAVSTNGHVDKEYRLDEAYREPGLLQFWNCGTLNNMKVSVEIPKLEFGIAHDHGPVWCLEWCPSGCYETQPDEQREGFRRLGILAVGSAHSFVYVYAVYLPGQLSGKIFKIRPSLKLVLETLYEEKINGLEPHVTRISWSKASGHQTVAVGYANGVIAVYNLATNATLLKLKTDEDDVESIRPYRVLNAHYHAVTALSLYHLNDGRRWLMSASTDRSIKYWDLDNPAAPISSFMKAIVTDGVWLNHWLSTIQTFDDSCGGGLTATTAHQFRNFESESGSIMHSNSRVSSITGSEWTNGFVQGNIVGELMGYFPHQMFFCMDGDKARRTKRVVLSYARMIDINMNRTDGQMQEIDDHESCMYKKVDNKYGLSFCDMKVNNVRNFAANMDSYFKSNKSDKLYPNKPHVYPMQAITHVVFNPNRDSYLYLATGYHVGLVKISYLGFLHGLQ